MPHFIESVPATLLTVAVATSLSFLNAANGQSSDSLRSLKPVMNIPAERVYASSFDKAAPLDKSNWQSRQGTQWKTKDGLLHGEQSTAEYQAKKKDHKGLEPRIKSLKTPSQFVASFSVRFTGGEETNLLPLIEFGHHNVRVKFSSDRVQLLADHESVLLAETKSLKLESGQWVHVLAERNGDQFVIQFADGPTIYAQHKSLAIPVANAADGLGIAGTRLGVLDIDNVSLWSIKPGFAKGWEQKRKQFPRFEPKTIEKKKKRRK